MQALGNSRVEITSVVSNSNRRFVLYICVRELQYGKPKSIKMITRCVNLVGRYYMDYNYQIRLLSLYLYYKESFWIDIMLYLVTYPSILTTPSKWCKQRKLVQVNDNFYKPVKWELMNKKDVPKMDNDKPRAPWKEILNCSTSCTISSTRSKNKSSKLWTHLGFNHMTRSSCNCCLLYS